MFPNDISLHQPRIETPSTCLRDLKSKDEPISSSGKIQQTLSTLSIYAGEKYHTTNWRISLVKHLTSFLHIVARFPRVRQDYIENVISPALQEEHRAELDAYLRISDEPNDGLKRWLFLLPMLVCLLHSLKGVWFVYMRFSLFDPAHFEANLERVDVKLIDSENGVNATVVHMTQFACIITNCTRLSLDNTTFAKDLTKLPIVSICNPRSVYLYGSVYELGDTSCLLAIIDTFAVILLALGPVIYSSSGRIDHILEFIMFIQSPNVSLQLMLRRATNHLGTIKDSHLNYRSKFGYKTNNYKSSANQRRPVRRRQLSAEQMACDSIPAIRSTAFHSRFVLYSWTSFYLGFAIEMSAWFVIIVHIYRRNRQATRLITRMAAQVRLDGCSIWHKSQPMGLGALVELDEQESSAIEFLGEVYQISMLLAAHICTTALIITGFTFYGMLIRETHHWLDELCCRMSLVADLMQVRRGSGKVAASQRTSICKEVAPGDRCRASSVISISSPPMSCGPPDKGVKVTSGHLRSIYMQSVGLVSDRDQVLFSSREPLLDVANLRRNGTRETYINLIHELEANVAQCDLEDLITSLYLNMRLFVEYVDCSGNFVGALVLFGYLFNYGAVVICVWYVKRVPTFYEEPMAIIAAALLAGNLMNTVASALHAKVSLERVCVCVCVVKVVPYERAH